MPAVQWAMAYRTFIDADGVTWQVWDVHPELAERRAADRRRMQVPPPTPPGDRRAGNERRRRAERRVQVRPGFEHGWLVFDSAVGVRRLAPGPPDWENLPDTSLVAWCRQALETGRTRRRLIE
ncbi:MAG TPA: hypothetical protein VGF26_04830 [Ramlibacter sp.]